MDGKIPTPWLEFISAFDLLEMDVEELASRSERWRRVIELYKQKCKVSILAAAVKDGIKEAWDYYVE